MNELLEQTRNDLFLILPMVQLSLFGLGVLITDFLLEARYKYWNAVMAMLGLAFSGFSLWRLHAILQATGRTELLGFNRSLVIDNFFIFFSLIFLASTALVILLSVRYMEIEQEHHGEYYALMLFAVVGMMFMAAGYDIVVQFLGLETMAISFYVLAGFLRSDRRSNEGSLKYLLLGAFSSGIFAYGLSILFGLSGSTNVENITAAVANIHQQRSGDILVLLALVTVAAGLFFKVAAVPFHMWAPDVYEGAPTPITAYVSVASKAASFALLLRLFQTVFWPEKPNWELVLATVAVASLTLGNLAAITQNNLKRLLAYSSISHVGYVLLGLVAGNEAGLLGVSFYLFVYAFMTTGAFAVIIVLRRRGLIGDDIEDLNGLIQRSPSSAVLMLIFILSLAGIPPTAGFLGKYYIFLSLIQTGHIWLAVFGALYIVPAVYYYFRIVVHAFMRESLDPEPVTTSPAQAVALTVTLFITLAAGLYPQPFAQLARLSVFDPFNTILGFLGR